MDGRPLACAKRKLAQRIADAIDDMQHADSYFDADEAAQIIYDMLPQNYAELAEQRSSRPLFKSGDTIKQIQKGRVMDAVEKELIKEASDRHIATAKILAGILAALSGLTEAERKQVIRAAVIFVEAEEFFETVLQAIELRHKT